MPDCWISSSTSSHGGFVGRSAKSMPQLTGLAASLTELVMGVASWWWRGLGAGGGAARGLEDRLVRVPVGIVGALRPQEREGEVLDAVAGVRIVAPHHDDVPVVTGHGETAVPIPRQQGLGAHVVVHERSTEPRAAVAERTVEEVSREEHDPARRHLAAHRRRLVERE